MPARMGDSAPFSAPYVKLWLLCRTPLCAPRFAFHVHAFQTRSFRCFPLYGDFPVGPSGAFPSAEISPSVHPALSLMRRFPRRFIWRFPSVKILPPLARLFPCRRLHRPALLRCAPGRYSARPALPSMFMLFRHVPSGAFPSTEISSSVRPALPLCEDSPAARPAFSRVGGCTGLRFCIAPPDDTLSASLCLLYPYFSDTFLLALPPL